MVAAAGHVRPAGVTQALISGHKKERGGERKIESAEGKRGHRGMLQQRTWCALSGHGATACTAHSAVSVAEQAPDRVSHAHAVASCTTCA